MWSHHKRTSWVISHNLWNINRMKAPLKWVLYLGGDSDFANCFVSVCSWNCIGENATLIPVLQWFVQTSLANDTKQDINTYIRQTSKRGNKSWSPLGLDIMEKRGFEFVIRSADQVGFMKLEFAYWYFVMRTIAVTSHIKILTLCKVNYGESLCYQNWISTFELEETKVTERWTWKLRKGRKTEPVVKSKTSSQKWREIEKMER